MSVNGEKIVEDALKTIVCGTNVEVNELLKTLQKAETFLERDRFLKEVSGDTLIIGPCRGHAADLAHYLQKDVLYKASRGELNIVFLGNYVDGGHQSLEVLYLVALMVQHFPSVVPLIGSHEMYYPFPSGDFGSLQGELRLRSIQMGVPLDTLEEALKDFFTKLPVVCIVNKRFFCSSSGLASEYRFISTIAQESSQMKLSGFIQNKPMDEDEDRLASGCAFVGAQSEIGSYFRYSFDAMCNFLSRNNLYTHIGGLEYHTGRYEVETFSRLNRHRESTYFPGYVLGRFQYRFHVPTHILLFSAPHFAGVNQNYGCTLAIKGETLELRQFDVYMERPIIMPGNENHAFSWSQEILERSLTSIIHDIMFADIPKPPENEDNNDPACTQEAQNMKSRYLRMCQLLKSHSLPLPN
ncbi:kinetoplastid-specific phospho-protein phosphatase [Trypanosoma theileri]|uniref:Kinetoplastid-specific phospho-protein phosphatase n=1 Tax=Trypanosoma theileri TaxID=67003 RepID=A0A1X0NMS7_9TRYP|nr:kinetoplastid-specific phospho-protein phosphatase [Trypanosoma theileri]ORC85793.1 kinetoplastid-specific phospho-protein phosphatase [Trypanosoma theileri]